MKYIIPIIMAIICTSTFAGTRDPSVPDLKYIEYGSKFECVVKIIVQTQNNIKHVASAVIIDKHWIVTAAHVVQSCKSASIEDHNNKQYCLSDIYVHKDFINDKFGVADIALGYSPDPIECTFYPQLYSNDDEVGKVVCMAGYGVTGTFNSGSTLSDNKKRAGSNKIDIIQDDLLICSPSITKSVGHTELEFLISHGDSGGGLFIDQKLAGINSCVMASDSQPNSDYGDESGHTRISKYKTWIDYIITTQIKNLKSKNTTNIIIDHNILYIIISISLSIVFFCLGYGWCKILSLSQNLYNNSINTNHYKNIKSSNITKQDQKSLDIDDSKVVVSIKTDGLEKKYGQLGDIQQTQDSIDNSVNKLKNIKK